VANETNDLSSGTGDRPEGNGTVKRHFGGGGNSRREGLTTTGTAVTSAATTTQARATKYPEEIVAHNDRGSQVTEDYRALRTSLMAAGPQGRFSFLVTSAEPGEGKTVTCLNLAMVLAERTDRTTVVVDANFRNGRLSKLLKAADGPGLAELLRGEASLAQAVQATAYPNLFCIPTGRARRADEKVSQLFTPELANIVDDLRRQYDHVLFDTPAVHTAPDAGIIGAAAVDAMMVVKMYKTRRESFGKAIRLLRGANVRVAGVILNERKFFIPNAVYHSL
jgi:capsular exopolysaccharide synthesis family protein